MGLNKGRGENKPQTSSLTFKSFLGHTDWGGKGEPPLDSSAHPSTGSSAPGTASPPGAATPSPPDPAPPLLTLQNIVHRRVIRDGLVGLGGESGAGG